MSKNLYKMANVYINKLTKSARHEEEERLFREEDPEDMYIPKEDEDEDEDLEDLEEPPFELGEGKFEDFAPETRGITDDFETRLALLDDDEQLMDMDTLPGNYKKDTDYKFEDEDLYNQASMNIEKSKQNKKKGSIFMSPVIKMAMLFAKAEKKGTEGAFFEGLEDLPEEESASSLKDALNDTGYEAPSEEIDQGVAIDDDDELEAEDAGDPGEFMPLSDEEAEVEKEMRQNRLEMLKERHKAYLEGKIAPKDEDEELESFEMGPGHDEDILSKEDKDEIEEEKVDETDFEDEDEDEDDFEDEE